MKCRSSCSRRGDLSPRRRFRTGRETRFAPSSPRPAPEAESVGERALNGNELIDIPASTRYDAVTLATSVQQSPPLSFA